jgi:hypothetical protein
MSWMLSQSDSALASKHVSRLTPSGASRYAGTLVLSNGRPARIQAVHSVDPVITDGKFVVAIDRVNDPGKGLPALPGVTLAQPRQPGLPILTKLPRTDLLG